MGFVGALRKVFKDVENATDMSVVSKRLGKELDTYHLPQLREFFVPKQLSVSDGKLMLGQSEFKSFIDHARMGSFTNSFQMAFKGSDLLKVPSARLAIDRVLRDATNELPDARVADFVARRNKTMKSTKLSDQIDSLKTTDDVKKFVESNPDVSRLADKVVKSSKRTGFVKMFGYSVAIAATTFGLAELYDYCVTEAKNGTGCFMYTKRNNDVTKCKIGYLSCKYATGKNLCNSLNCTDGKTGVSCLPDDDKTTCADKTLLCEKCDSNNPDPNLKLADNQILKCEEKKPAEILGEAIAAVTDTVGSFIGSGIGNVLKWGLIIIAVLLVIFFAFKFVFSSVFSPSPSPSSSTIYYVT